METEFCEERGEVSHCQAQKKTKKKRPTMEIKVNLILPPLRIMILCLSNAKAMVT